ILQLESELAGARKNSSNSSKPPSSDIVKPPKDKPPVDQKTKRKVKRKRGAQKGYKQNLRKPLAPELIDEIVKLELSHCPDCGKTRNIFPISTAKSGDWKEKETNNSL
ncbi:MAG: DUF6444 domain-containing protein, partial [Planctomycetaceae bacterium]|nr:DUF6444 domain-containing protein [Planctomycetaceae bacterium]